MAKEKIRTVIIGGRKIVLSTKVFVDVENCEQKVLADIIEQLADHIREQDKIIKNLKSKLKKVQK